MFELLLNQERTKHCYSLGATGIKIRRNEGFISRVAAEHAMHLLMAKYGLHIENVYEDKHFKTYLCNNDVRFYINRF